ncbi:CDP-diacylglycerol--glycerol-3-phosphate 3-phosphatidyltransferase [Venenivibrio stagnispumantis]|uniref:CDP-diacylglycerol--glycerol-3-phosphate 3-phosphatidyltransferase n=1 Tax=Venenivibrio stagnispumantis TaxID=407998 RepID=A0AA45WM06_9AQUI|nr:CDP-diacylglycerol--glycerol-3-phosphate 3-phosphatidyltransferase [Venenivibrio stagnispumantis]MCW4572889.1 CDP-diacylglycerol--glycerol-3-phosphate 3-phosphatidyltransferase [Venenivibrio stagnispumantis]SMP12850.1 CDP-diacylglycerol--glycerol-3-phosphate 3-phosphatidyltransferase [Venenivibrio stagnispumantis]
MIISLANLTTLSRLAIIPFLIYAILNEKYIISGILTGYAIFSDYIDGIIARANKDVTKHGELLDPAVDKIFTISVLVAFVEKQVISTYVVFLIVLREMIITWVRSVLVNKGIVLPASYLGKIKTTFQMIGIFLLTINFNFYGVIFLWISIFFAYVSAIDYFRIFYREKAWI